MKIMIRKVRKIWDMEELKKRQNKLIMIQRITITAEDIQRSMIHIQITTADLGTICTIDIALNETDINHTEERIIPTGQITGRG